MARLLDDCARYAATDYPILLLGPPGSGKTALARHIHGLSGRSGDFVSCSTAGVPANLEVSLLGGHRRGAFTDAREDQPGLIEVAHRGTLFLDEIGLASPKVQEILLELLDEGTVRGVGETRKRPLDVRILAATNADLEAMCEAGTFRRDLLGRFGYFRIRLLPLRERRDEIIPLVQHYLELEARQIGRPEPPEVSDAVRDCLLIAPWRDNVRELRAVCQYLVTMCPVDRVARIEDLPPDFLAALGPLTARRAEQSRTAWAREALERAGGNKTKAARAMGISRQHLYRLLKRTPG